MAFDNQGKPIIGFDDTSALPIISHTPTGDTIYGTLQSETSSQPGTGDFSQTLSVDLDGIPLGPTLLVEKPLDGIASLQEHPGITYRKMPGPATAPAPAIDELKSLMAGLLRSTQAVVDWSIIPTNRPEDVSQSLPSRHSCPDRVTPPRLSSSTSANAFALQRHILALETYFQDVLLLWSPGEAKSAWKVSVANTSIAQTGGQFTTWLELYGKRAVSWEEWKALLKTHLLTRGWEQKLRHKFMLLRCLDTTPTAFDSFFHLLISYQAILHDFEDPLGDVDVCRRMLDGVDDLVTHRMKAALKANSQTVLTVNPADLHIIMIDLIDDAMPATHHLPPLVIAHVQVAPQAPKSYTPMQLEWLDPAKRLLLGEAGKAARMFLSSINTCFSCRQTGHHRLICPTRPLSSPPHNPSSAPVTNLISLADDDYADAPGIFSVDPVAEQLVQDGATTLAGSVPLIMVTCRVQANDDPATTLVDLGAGINVIDQDGDEDGG
ncbi:hypothetical protein I311_06815 [Cryptococcus gattii NT-10]|nr:hypothetical protein I311_06815 [Cryptococcus gattii NT-10]